MKSSEEMSITEYISEMITLVGKEYTLNRFQIMLNGLNQHIEEYELNKKSVITDIPIILKCIINELNTNY